MMWGKLILLLAKTIFVSVLFFTDHNLENQQSPCVKNELLWSNIMEGSCLNTVISTSIKSITWKVQRLAANSLVVVSVYFIA